MAYMRHLAICIVLLSTSVLAQAHHSYAMFDTTHQQVVHGTVKTIEWVSPHVWLWVEVDSGDGKTVPYGFETLSPGQLLRDFDWKRNSVNVGDKIEVTYAPLRSGRPGGGLVKVMLGNGQVLETRLSKASAGGAQNPQ
jgi:hypothetical protein